MKKKTTILYWIICISTILIGLGLFIIGTYLGGATGFSFTPSGLNFYNGFSTENNSALTKHTVTIDDAITTIDLNGDFGDVIICSGDTLTLTYDSDTTYDINDDTFRIYTNAAETKRWGISFTTKIPNTIEITLPSYVTDINIESSGKVTLRDLDLEYLSVSAPLGDILIETSSLTDAVLKADLGNVTLYDCTFSTLNSTFDMGALRTHNLDITSSAQFISQLGSMEIDLIKEETSYTFEHNVDLGTYSINNNSNSNASGDIKINTQSDMGSIAITTK